MEFKDAFLAFVKSIFLGLYSTIEISLPRIHNKGQDPDKQFCKVGLQKVHCVFCWTENAKSEPVGTRAEKSLDFCKTTHGFRHNVSTLCPCWNCIGSEPGSSVVGLDRSKMDLNIVSVWPELNGSKLGLFGLNVYMLALDIMGLYWV